MASKPINPPDCEMFTNAKEKDELYSVKIAAISIMNYLEDIAVLYQSGMADKYIIYITLKQPIMHYYNKIKPLSACIDSVAGYSSCKPLDDLINQWHDEIKNKSKMKPKKNFIFSLIGELDTHETADRI